MGKLVEEVVGRRSLALRAGTTGGDVATVVAVMTTATPLPQVLAEVRAALGGERPVS
ncbi:hypothetical protein [Amycolatopsis sp. NPDC004169]|uniref:hypothetical protein n=1 Tax=Amycolatopsis sp. NPDC004169 TaxID=3154453 RepID=UPI0033B42BE1